MTAFKRASIMQAAIAAIIADTSAGLKRDMAIQELGEYKSRGKGRNAPNGVAPGRGMAANRAAMKKRNQAKHRRACR